MVITRETDYALRILRALRDGSLHTTGQIAPMIGRTPSAVKMRLQKGRKLLEQAYGREEG